MAELTSFLNNTGDLTIHLASPETIRSWSYGEVTSEETVDYRKGTPVHGGLFCQRIFGPVKDLECVCGRYSGYDFRGHVCEHCEVRVDFSSIRRERMGHIELAAPVAHIWSVSILPSKLGSILGIKHKDLKDILYYQAYIAYDKVSDMVPAGTVISEGGYQVLAEEQGLDLPVGSGMESILRLLKSISFEATIESLEEQLEEITSPQPRAKLLERLGVLRDFVKSGNDPESLAIRALPVIPPGLRPIVGQHGRFAMSDLNVLYRRVVMRNIRLKRMMAMRAPDIMIRNEKRMLQEAVDSLLDNTKSNTRMTSGTNRRVLNSLAHNLAGKSGRFRSSLLGKRVDYSGRSVIVVGPKLKLHQCGLPKRMALELFRPLVIQKMVYEEVVHSIKEARAAIDLESSAVWGALAEVTKDWPVLLNRAPTLHRMGFQAFLPMLVEGNAIQLHPLACKAYNADFDGDQMAVHVPLTKEARQECMEILLSTKNDLSPASGKPTIQPTFDIVLGVNWMTALGREYESNEARRKFADYGQALLAYENKVIGLREPIEALVEGKRATTTIGRLQLHDVMKDCGATVKFSRVNQELTKGSLTDLLHRVRIECGQEICVLFADALKSVGMKYSTQSGLSLGLEDLQVEVNSETAVAEAEQRIAQLTAEFDAGLHSQEQYTERTLSSWTEADAVISKSIDQILSESSHTNSLQVYANSGARGSSGEIKQMVGWRGLMQGVDGASTTMPVKSSFQHGLTVPEFVLSSYGSRAKVAQGDSKTAEAGYLTRRMVDATTTVVVTTEDCGATAGIQCRALVSGNTEIISLEERLLGRYSVQEVKSLKGKVIVKAGSLITEAKARKVAKTSPEYIEIRSPVTCQDKDGICAKCYGTDLSTGKLVALGTPVGIIAAQSIGEPGTQSSLKAVKSSGTATRIFESGRITAESDGMVALDNAEWIPVDDHNVVVSRGTKLRIIDKTSGVTLESHDVPYGAQLSVGANLVLTVKAGDTIARWDPTAIPVITREDGWVYLDTEESGTLESVTDPLTGLSQVLVRGTEDKGNPSVSVWDEEGETQLSEFILPENTRVLVENESQVSKGQVLAEIPKRTMEEVTHSTGSKRFMDLVEARVPSSNRMIFAYQDGLVSISVDGRGRTVLTVENEESTQKEILEPGAVPQLVSGDEVQRGDILIDGVVSPTDILGLNGLEAVTNFIVDESQVVYRPNGVDIHDKHFEIIVRQMTRRVGITDPGDTDLIEGEICPMSQVLEANKKVENPAEYERVLYSITKAALAKDSFISAASFQTTAKVLIDAAFKGRRDKMRGIKENVIFGRPIPAGTGFQGENDVF